MVGRVPRLPPRKRWTASGQRKWKSCTIRHFRSYCVTDAEKLINALLENEDEDLDSDDLKEIGNPPEHTSGINTGLMDVLRSLGVTGDRISNRYSDTYVMCQTYQEAHTIANAGPWKSMAEVVRTNPQHPDAKMWPWLVDVPFANLGGYIGSKTEEL